MIKDDLLIDLIIIGDEILYGNTKDTNGHFISKRLFDEGAHLRQVKIVSDNEEDLKEALSDSLKKSSCIITTGGLGPTKDDLTKEIISNFLNLNIQFNEKAYNLSKSHYQRLKIEVPKDSGYYHVPKEVDLIENLEGLAPGLIFYQNNLPKIFCAPGVPYELESMLTNGILPIIRDTYSNNLPNTKKYVIKTHAIGEEQIFSKTAPSLWKDLSRFGKVSSLPSLTGTNIILRSKDHNLEKTIKDIISETELKKFVWCYEDLLPEEKLIKLCKEKGLTLSFAESCTGGLASSKITDISGSSEIFLGGIISYANEVKINSLGVEKKIIEEFGAVSTQVSDQMAQAVAKLTNSHLGISYSGIAGPGGGSVEKPVGTVAISISLNGNIVFSKLLNLRKKSRKVMKNIFANTGIIKAIQILTKDS